MMSRWFVPILLGIALAGQGCTATESKPDTRGVVDAAIPDDRSAPRPDRAPDTVTWITCGQSELERRCVAASGQACCLRPSSDVCPPSWTCEVYDCLVDPLTPDAGPCPSGSFCRSRGGCACIPSLASPCPCQGSCVASCSTAPRCEW